MIIKGLQRRDKEYHSWDKPTQVDTAEAAQMGSHTQYMLGIK